MAKTAVTWHNEPPAAGDVVGELRALSIDKAAIDPQLIGAAAREWSTKNPDTNAGTPPI